MTTPVPFEIDPTRFGIDKLQSIRDVEEAQLVARAFQAQVHLLQAQLVHAQEMHKLVSEVGARLAQKKG